MSTLLYGCTTWTLSIRMEKKLDGNYTRMLRAMLNKSWRQHATKKAAIRHSSQKLLKLDEPDMRDIAGEVRTNSWATYSSVTLHMEEQRQIEQLEPIYNSTVPIQDIALRISRERQRKRRDYEIVVLGSLALSRILWFQTGFTPLKEWPCVTSCSWLNGWDNTHNLFTNLWTKFK